MGSESSDGSDKGFLDGVKDGFVGTVKAAGAVLVAVTVLLPAAKDAKKEAES